MWEKSRGLEKSYEKQTLKSGTNPIPIDSVEKFQLIHWNLDEVQHALVKMCLWMILGSAPYLKHSNKYFVNDVIIQYLLFFVPEIILSLGVMGLRKYKYR